jgi:hypothetical protein
VATPDRPWGLDAQRGTAEPRKEPGPRLSDAVLTEARQLAAELQGQEHLIRQREHYLAVQAYLEAVIRGDPAEPPAPPSLSFAPPTEEEVTRLAEAHAGPNEVVTRMNLASRRASVHYQNYELAEDLKVLSYHVAALRARAAPYPHADV